MNWEHSLKKGCFLSGMYFNSSFTSGKSIFLSPKTFSISLVGERLFPLIRSDFRISNPSCVFKRTVVFVLRHKMGFMPPPIFPDGYYYQQKKLPSKKLDPLNYVEERRVCESLLHSCNFQLFLFYHFSFPLHKGHPK